MVQWLLGGRAEQNRSCCCKVSARTKETKVCTNNIRARIQQEIELEMTQSAYMIKAALHREGSGSTKVKIEALHCFVDFAEIRWNDTTKTTSLLQSLIPDMTGRLLETDTQSDAVEAFVELLSTHSMFFTTAHMEELATVLQTHFLPSLEESITQGDLVYSDPARLLVEFSTAVVEHVMERPEGTIAQLALRSIGSILRSDGVPGDDGLSPLTIEFWNTYVESVVDEIFSHESDVKPSWYSTSQKVMTEACHMLWKKLWIPSSEVTSGWTNAERDEFKTFRTDTADIFSSMYICLDKDIVIQLVRLTTQGLTDKEWRAVEAGVYSLNALADNALEYEENDKFLSPLFESSLLRDIADFDQPIPTPVRRTVIDMIGEYGALIKRNPVFIPDAVRYLFASLAHPTLASVSAQSVFELCSVCRCTLTKDLDSFLAQYKTGIAVSGGDLYVKEKVIGGIAAIIQALPNEESKIAPLSTLLESIEYDMSRAEQSLSSGDVESATTFGVSALRCLVSMGKASQTPEDAPIDLEEEQDPEKKKFWVDGAGKLIQDRIVGCFGVLKILGNHGEIVETICQVLRTGFTETTPGPFVLPAIVTVSLLQQCTITTSQVEAVLSAACLLITHHSKSDAAQIPAEVQAIFDQTLSFMQALGRPNEDPSVSQTCLDITTRMIPAYISCLLETSEVQLRFVLEFSLQAIEGQDVMPKRSALDFWSKLIKAGTESSPTMPEMKSKAREVLTAFGPLVSLALVRQVCGVGQRSDLDHVNEPVKDLFANHTAHAKSWFEQALTGNNLPPITESVGTAEKQRFVAQLAGLRGGSRTKEVIRDFYAACRGVVSTYR